MSAAVLPGQVFAGYRIEAVAGRGGMGIVYRATHVGRDQTVALKLIAPELAADAAFRERFQRECKLLASLDHPNVITVYEAGEAEGQPFISMRYVEGTELQTLIAGEGRLAPERAARLVAQAADGLDAAHTSGLVHRDVKPANVLIERRDATEHAYLSDFGLTKEVNATSSITRDGRWVGTLDYVAPEQIEGGHVDARSDVYALGCVLFQTLTGRVPYIGDSDAAKLNAHLNLPAPSARELCPRLPPEIDEVITRAMAKDPAERYLSAGDLGRAAIAAAGGEAITQPEHSVARGAAAPKARGRLTRGRLGALVAGLLGVAAVGAIALTRSADEPVVEQPTIEHIDLGGRVLPGAITSNFHGAYMVDRFGDQVLGVHRSGVVEARLKVGDAPTDIRVDPDGNRLWVASANDGTVRELEASTGRRRGRAIRVQPAPAYLGVMPDDTLIVLSKGKRPSILWLNKKTHRPFAGPLEIKDIPLGRGGIDSFPVPSDTGSVEVKELTPDLKRRLVQLRNNPVDAEATRFPVRGSIAIAFGAPPRIVTLSPDQRLQPKTFVLRADFRSVPGDMVIDDATGVAWVVIAGADVAGKDISKVLRINMRTGKQIGNAIKVGRSPSNLAIDDGVVWVPAVGDQTVTRIDQKSGRVIGKPLKVGRISGAVAASDGIVWVAGEKDLIRITPP